MTAGLESNIMESPIPILPDQRNEQDRGEEPYSEYSLSVERAPRDDQQMGDNVHAAAHSLNNQTVVGDLVQSRQYACLYTKHKTQKRKVYQDGRLFVRNYEVVLYDAHPKPGSGDPILDQCELNRSEIDAIHQGRETHLEMEKHLVTIEGPWLPSTSCPAPSPLNALKNLNHSHNMAVSGPMQRLLHQKYQKPPTRIPPPNAVREESAFKRRRPLQPGELVRRYYGQAATSQHLHHLPCKEPTNDSYGQEALSDNDVSRRRPVSRIEEYQTLEPRGPVEYVSPFAQDGKLLEMDPQRGSSAHPRNEFDRSRPMEYHVDGGQNGVHQNSRKQGVAAFANRNGFDPSSFYGEDGSDGSDEQTEISSPIDGSAKSEQQASKAFEMPGGKQAAPQASRLSTNQLLSLFGASFDESVGGPPTRGEGNKVGQSGRGEEDEFALPPQDDSSEEE